MGTYGSLWLLTKQCKEARNTVFGAQLLFYYVCGNKKWFSAKLLIKQGQQMLLQVQVFSDILFGKSEQIAPFVQNSSNYLKNAMWKNSANFLLCAATIINRFNWRRNSFAQNFKGLV